MKRILVTAALTALSPVAAFGQYMQIGGAVVTMYGAPVPGVIVQLVNPQFRGQSYPVTTGPTGEYFFPEVPTNVMSLYSIQVLWGGRVIFSRIVPHPGAQDPIVIPLR